MPWSQQLVPGPVLCQDFAANHGLLPPPLPAPLGPWGDGGSCALRLMSAELRMAPEREGHGLESPRLPGQNQGQLQSQAGETGEEGNHLAGAQSLPKGGGGVGHAWAGKRGQRRRQHTWPPSPPAPIQSAAGAVIGGRGPWLHPSSLTSRRLGQGDGGAVAPTHPESLRRKRWPRCL